MAALAAVSVFVCADGFGEFEAGYVQGEMLKESAESLISRPDQQATYVSPVASSRQARHSRGSELTKSPALVCLSTCVLLC